MSKGFKETEIGRIPSEWEESTLDNLCSITTGKKDVNEGNPDGLYPFFTCSTKATRSDTYSFDDEAILIAGNGDVGHSKYYKGKFEAYQRTYVLCNFKCNAHFLHLYLSGRLQGRLLSKKSGSTMPYIRKGDLSTFSTPHPPLPEQKKIAAVLSKLQQAIEIQDNILGSLRDLKKSMMHRLFSYGLKGEKRKKTEIGLIPEGWEVKTFETIIQQGQYGLSVRGKEDGQYPILRMNCQKDGYVVWNNLQYIDIDENTWMKFKIKNGDLLFNRTNSIDLVGRMAIYDSDKDAVIASYLIRLTLKQDVALPRFFNYYFNMESTQTALKGLATRGVSQSNISLSKLKTFRIPIAPLREQTEIAHILQTIDRKIEIHEGKKSGQQDIFKTMLNNLMTGTIRVNELDIDTAEVEAA